MRDHERPGRWTRLHVAAVVLLLAVLLGALLMIYRLTDNRPTGTVPGQVAAESTPTLTPGAAPSATMQVSPPVVPEPPPLVATSPPVQEETRPPLGTGVPPAPTATPPPPPPAVVLPARLAARTVTDQLRVRSAPGVGEESIRYEPPLPEGTGFRILEGPVYVSEYWWYRVGEISARLKGGVEAGWVASADHDGTPWIGPARDACFDFEFQPGDVTVVTFDELRSNFVGTWAGCASTPWTPPYWVTLDFRQDGTYGSYAEAAPDGVQYPALYYGTDDDSVDKRYLLDDLHDSGFGSGQIDIAFDVGTVNRDELRNIAILGDRMEFEFFHAGYYGPILYRLYRQR